MMNSNCKNIRTSTQHVGCIREEESNDNIKSTGEKMAMSSVTISLPSELKVSVPPCAFFSADEQQLKEFIWKHHKDTLLSAMTLTIHLAQQEKEGGEEEQKKKNVKQVSTSRDASHESKFSSDSYMDDIMSSCCVSEDGRAHSNNDERWNSIESTSDENVTTTPSIGSSCTSSLNSRGEGEGESRGGVKVTTSESKGNNNGKRHRSTNKSHTKDSCSASLLKKRLELLDRVAEVQRQYLESKGPKVVYGALLQGILDLMNSEYGFISEVKYEADGTMYLHSHSTTTNSWDPGAIKYFQDYAAGLKFYKFDTLFGRALTTKLPIISNNPATDQRKGRGCPMGHPPLTNFLGIPFLHKNGDVIGMIAIANTSKPGGFTEADVDFMEPFTVTSANLVQAYVQIETNNHLINTLEHKVNERTHKLEAAVDDLASANIRVLEASAAQLKHFACMSHEIRTPLNCIIGLSSLLLENAQSCINNRNSNVDPKQQEQHKLSPCQEEGMQMIVTSGDLLLTVVNDVLDYSKLQNGNVEIDIQRSNLQETLNGIVHSIEMKATSISKQLSVRTAYDVALPEFVTTDTRRLQQILYNLLGNAMKFSPDNSVIQLTVQLLSSNEANNNNKKKKDKETSLLPSSSSSIRGRHHQTTPSFELADARAALEEVRHHVNFSSFSSLSSVAESHACPFAPTTSPSLSEDLVASPATTGRPMHSFPPSPRCPKAQTLTVESSTASGYQTKTSSTTGFPPCHRHQEYTQNSINQEDGMHSNYRNVNEMNSSYHKVNTLRDYSVFRPEGEETQEEPAARRILRIKVKDFGVGIASEDFCRIFEPFSQAKAETERVFGGTGLGLAITSKLVHALGGNVSVDSEEGKWSEFTVDLPFRDAPADVDGISRGLKDTHIFFVADCPKTKEHMSTIVAQYSTTATYFRSMKEMDSYIEKGTLSIAKTYICLVHEDQYIRESYNRLADKARSVLFTFGPQFLVNETKGHFRNLMQVLPSVLMKSLSVSGQIMITTGSRRSENNQMKVLLTRESPLHQRTSSANLILNQKLLILIAEDNKINQKVLARMLDRMGMKNFDIVDNGQLAVEQEATKEYDLILMDMQMPVMDGVEATRFIVKRKERPHPIPKIVFVTAHAAETFEQECMKMGGSAFIAKPFSIHDIESMIHRLFPSK